MPDSLSIKISPLKKDSITASKSCFVRLLPASLFLLLTLTVAGNAATTEEVSFETSDGGMIYGQVYGSGDHAVVLAHGAVFNKESWREQAIALSKAGLTVLAIDFRGYGRSRAGSKGTALHLDLLAAMKHMKDSGAKRVSLLGGSMGGAAAAKAVALAKPGSVDRLILLAPAGIDEPRKLHGRILFIGSEDDWATPGMKDAFRKTPAPRKLTLLKGKAHAQHIFKTTQSNNLLEHITRWLTKDSEVSN
jgi:dienelactone hydrolase